MLAELPFRNQSSASEEARLPSKLVFLKNLHTIDFFAVNPAKQQLFE